MNTDEFLRNETKAVAIELSPFPFYDMQTAVREAIDVGENSDYVIDAIEEQKASFGSMEYVSPLNAVQEFILRDCQDELDDLGYKGCLSEFIESQDNFYADMNCEKREDLQEFITSLGKEESEFLSQKTKLVLDCVGVEY